MGSFGTAVFIRNEKQKTKEEFTEEFCKSMEKRGYKLATEKSGSSYVLVFSENSDWVTLKRTAYEGDRAAVMEDSGWFAENMQTHCISIGLVDSDFAPLSLYCQSKEVTDLAVVGDPTGYMGGNPSSVKRGTKEYWKPLLKKGCTWEQFQAVMTADYTFAEDGLEEMAPLLGMDMDSVDTDESQPDGDGQNTIVLYFRKGKRTPSLNTVFKQVFGEGLKEHGFVKIKGKQPYLVRAVGDEIIHVITCKSEWCGDRGYQKFSIWGGVATVYRLSFDLERSPQDNTDWLSQLFEYYTRPDPVGYDWEKWEKICPPMYYKEDDTEAVRSQMEQILCLIEKVMLPVMDKVTNLDACIEYFRVFDSPALNIPDYYEDRDDFGWDRSNEGLLYIQTNNHDNLVDRYQRMIDELDRQVKSGKELSRPYEIERKALEEWRINTVAQRDQIYNNPELYEKAMEELKRRKQKNQETLRSYGLEI